MKKLIFWTFSFVCIFFIVNSAGASTQFNHVVSLEPGWSLVSTPRLLASHEFSVPEISDNYDIYVLNPGSISGWATMAEIGQTEFQPLFGYFINNKTGLTTTLTFNYKENVLPNERFFSRTIAAGWNSLGIANPGYALKQKDADALDTNNVKNILDSLNLSAQSVYDLTAGQTPKSSTKISDVWANYIYNDANSLDDFRETKAYVVYNTSPGVYNGFQNNDPVHQTGRLTVTQNGPSAGNVGKSTTDVTLLNFTMTAQSALDISRSTITLATSNITTDEIANLKMQINGVTVSQISSPGLTDNVFNDTWSLPAGTTVTGRIAIDITNTADGNETISAALKALGANWTIKTSDTGDTVTDIVPSGNLTGNTMNVTASAITVDRASTPASGSSYVKGFVGAPIAGFAFTAGSASDITINSIKVTAYDDADASNTWTAGDKGIASGAQNAMVAVSLWDNSVSPAVQVGTTKSLTVGSTDITATFDTLNWVIAKNSTKNLVAKANISTSLAASADIALTIAALGDVNAQYGSGNNIAVTLNTNNNTPTIYQIINTGGTLTQTLASDTPTTGLVVAGTAGVAYTKVKFSATNEDFLIDKLTFLNSANDANFSNVAVTYPKDCLSTPTMETKSGTLVAGVVNFAGLNFKVCKDQNAYITIKGDLNTTLGGATNGNASYFAFDYDSTFNNAVGQDSGVVKSTIGSADAGSATQTVYQTIPTVVLNANSPSGNLIPNANMLVAKYDILATGTKDITMGGAAGDQLKVEFAGTFAVNTKAVKITDGTNTLCTGTVSTTTFTCDFATGATGSLDIAPGSTKTLWIYLNTSAAVQYDTVQAFLDDGSANNFIWSIDADAGHYATGAITFKNKIYAGSFQRP